MSGAPPAIAEGVPGSSVPGEHGYGRQWCGSAAAAGMAGWRCTCAFERVHTVEVSSAPALGQGASSLANFRLAYDAISQTARMRFDRPEFVRNRVGCAVSRRARRRGCDRQANVLLIRSKFSRTVNQFLRQGPEFIRNRTNTAEEHTAVYHTDFRKKKSRPSLTITGILH